MKRFDDGKSEGTLLADASNVSESSWTTLLKLRPFLLPFWQIAITSHCMCIDGGTTHVGDAQSKL